MVRQIWPWFMIGFVATFCILASLITTYAMLPSGEAVVQMKLWRFYLNEWPRFFGTHALGPTGANRDGLVTMTFQHVGLASVGGVVIAVVAAWFKRRAAKTN